jgi:hypothetical protein
MSVVGNRKHAHTHVVAYLLKARSMEPEKQQFIGNGCVTPNNGIAVASGSGFFLCC